MVKYSCVELFWAKCACMTCTNTVTEKVEYYSLKVCVFQEYCYNNKSVDI